MRNNTEMVNPDRYDGAADSGGGLAVLSTLEAIDAAAGEWRSLERTAPAPVLFQSHAWCRVLAARMLASSSGRRQPAIAVLREAGRIVALLPLSRRRIGPLRLGTLLGEPLAQYGDVIAAPDRPHAPARLISAIARSRLVDWLRLRRVREDSAAAHALGERSRTLGSPQLARSVDLSQFGDARTLSHSVDRKAARDRERLLRRLQASGRIETLHLSPGMAAREAVQLAIAWKTAWLRRRMTSSSAFADNHWLAGIADLSAEPTVDSLTTVLLRDGEPVAVELGFRHNSRHYAFLGAARPDLERLSPGKAAMAAALARCIENGLQSYDLLAPDEPYKRTWCPDTTVVEDRAIAFNALGATFGVAERGGMRIAGFLRDGFRPSPASPATGSSPARPSAAEA